MVILLDRDDDDCHELKRRLEAEARKAGFTTRSAGKAEVVNRLVIEEQDAGYFGTGLRKIEAARAVATYMDPARNRSPSFAALRAALEEMRGP